MYSLVTMDESYPQFPLQLLPLNLVELEQETISLALHHFGNLGECDQFTRRDNLIKRKLYLPPNASGKSWLYSSAYSFLPESQEWPRNQETETVFI